MNRIEELLSQAYHEAADTVRPETVRGTVPRPAPRRLRRRLTTLAPLAAAVAVVLAIAAAVAIPRLVAGNGATEYPASSAPPPFLVQLPYTGTATAKLVVQAVGTKHVTGMVSAPAGSQWAAVAATGSGTSFVAAATDAKRCVTRLYNLALTASGKPAGLRAFGQPIAGQLTSSHSLAADGDGSEVAYGAEACGSNQGAGSIGLMTPGSISRHWTLPLAGVLGSLSLTSDGRTLLYQDVTEPLVSTVWRLSTIAPSGGAHARSQTVLAENITDRGRTLTSAAISTDGKTVYIAAQSGHGPYTDTLATYSVAGRLLHTLHTWRNEPTEFYPHVTSGGDELILWAVVQPGTFEVDPVTGKTTSFWMYTPDGEFPDSIAW